MASGTSSSTLRRARVRRGLLLLLALLVARLPDVRRGCVRWVLEERRILAHCLGGHLCVAQLVLVDIWQHELGRFPGVAA
eukprot:COSAG06_NODE_1618_length_8914_cov_10.299830_1_plen_79_part_10